jgi:1,4-alpha-glucan branching enzyme
MPISQSHITASTAMGANLNGNGATFRVWAPDAEAVYVNGMFGGTNLFREDTDKTGAGRAFSIAGRTAIAISFTLSVKARKASSAIPTPGSLQHQPTFLVLSAFPPAIAWSATRQDTNGGARAFVRQLSTT